MTFGEQHAWYDALTVVRWKLEDADPEDPWIDSILELQDMLWWSSDAFRMKWWGRDATNAD